MKSDSSSRVSECDLVTDAQVGFGQSSQYQAQQSSFGQPSSDSVKSKIIHLISAIRTLLRSRLDPPLLTLVPLAIVNVVVIVYKLILG